jgi:hypothetical protein
VTLQQELNSKCSFEDLVSEDVLYVSTEYTCNENPEVEETNGVNGESPLVPTADYIGLVFFMQSVLTCGL